MKLNYIYHIKRGVVKAAGETIPAEDAGWEKFNTIYLRTKAPTDPSTVLKEYQVWEIYGDAFRTYAFIVHLATTKTKLESSLPKFASVKLLWSFWAEPSNLM